MGKFLYNLLSEKFNIPVNLIGCKKGPKTRERVLVHWVGQYVLHTICQFNIVTASAIFNCDRTMVNYSCIKIEDKRDDYNFDEFLSKIEKTVSLEWEKIKNDSC